MKSCVALAMASWVAVSALAQSSAADGVSSRLGWIAGCWSGQRGPATFKEIWIATPDLALGLSVTTVPGKPPEFEFLRIENRNGVPTYLAQPGGRPPTAFASTSASADAVIFANPQHDFPKRIGYQRAGDALTAWIDGGDAGKGRQELPMKRTKCP